MGGGGGGWGLPGQVQKKFRAREIKWKKVHARQLILRNIHATAWKNSYKEFDNEKNFLRLENFPLPSPITFLMVRPLEGSLSLALPPAENIKKF